jgi:hypothetical protein
VRVTIAEGLDDIEDSIDVGINELSDLLKEWEASIFRKTLTAFTSAKFSA